MKKKIILCICIVVIVVLVITLITMSARKDFSQKEENTPIGKDETFYEGGNEATEEMKPINQNMELGDVLQDVKESSVNKLTGISNEEANELINLGEYEGLEKRVAKYEDEENFTEVWLFKISEQNQASKIFRKFNNRINELRFQYEDNPQISAILNDEKNIVMKQQQGIAIIIISNNIEEVEKAVDKEFLK